MKHRITFLMTLVAMIFGTYAAVNAQNKRPAWSKGLNGTRAQEAVRAGRPEASLEIVAKIQAAYSEGRSSNAPADRRLVGTWNCTVDAGFNALQTFGVDGIFVETSSLLGTLVEGPAHGVWEPRKGGAVLTFEVFEFDPDGNEIGRVRVRNFIHLTDENNFVSDYAIDFIELNGDVIPDLATGSFTGKRMQVRGL